MVRTCLSPSQSISSG